MISKTERQQFDFLKGGGEMGEIMRAKNWKNTSLGDPETWPQSLKFAVSTMLHTAFPNFIFWGEQYVCLYNDAYRPSLGFEGKHPSILGQKGKEAWPEIWDTIHPLLESVWKTGNPTWSEDQYIPFYRNGKIEDIYWTFSYSALINDDGKIGGVLTTCVETTDAVKSLEKLKESEDELKFAINATELGTWDYNPITNILKTNHRLREWFGLPLTDEVTLEQATNAIIEKDRERVNAAIEHAINPKTSGNYDISYTIQNLKTGEDRYVRAVGRAWFNDQDCYRFNGTLQDITEKHQGELERLRLTTLIETSHELIGLSDMKGNVGYANPAAMEMMGWDTTANKTSADCVYPEDLQQAKKALHLAVKKGSYSCEMRLWNLKTKKPFWIQWNAFVIKDPESDEKIGLGTVSINIEERKAQESELRDALDQIRKEKDRFQNLVQDAPTGIGIFKGKNYVIEFANKAALTSIGQDADKAIGTPLFDIMADARDTLQPIFDKVFNNGTGIKSSDIGMKIEINGKKETYYFNLNCEPIRNTDGKVTGVMAVSDDVTEAVKLRHILKENEKQFRSLIMQSPIPMAIYRGEMLVIEMVNHSMVRTFMRKKEGNIIGKPLIEAFPEMENQKYPELLRKVLSTGRPYSEKESYAVIEGEDGSREFYLDFDYAPLEELDGAVSGVMVTATDITDQVKARKKLEEFSKELELQVEDRTAQLSLSNQKLEQSIKELKASNEDLESFAYVSSHDLQEPLRKIQMFTSRIADRDSDNLSEKGQRDFEKITVAARRMRGLIEDLLAFSRTNTDTSEPEKKDLKEILEQVLEDLSDKIDATNTEIEVDDLMTAKVVPFQIRQVFQNLIENAIKFSKKNTAPKISITSEKTLLKKENALGLDSRKTYAHIAVKDQGIGFEPQFAEQIFDVFKRLHGKLEYDGTGIGLAIVKKIMMNHNGGISASSVKGSGATFDMYLPID